MSSLSRRQFFLNSSFAGAAAALVAREADAAPPRDYGPDASPVRYPDADIVTLDKRFDKYKLGNVAIRRIATGMLWVEGPVWNGVGKFVFWSDIPNDVQMRWLLEDGHVTTYRSPAGNSNGSTMDWQGRQISCEHGTRQVVRYEHSGAKTILAKQFSGKPFNAPNDVVVHPDGGIWFTDPGYGSMMHYEGNKGELYLKEAIYRIDGQTGSIAKVTEALAKPNGLCFSPDYKKLYVADTGGTNAIHLFDVTGDGKTLSKPRQFASMKLELDGKTVAGNADGMRCDRDGNVWASAGWVGDGYDGVHVFAPDGVRIGQIKLPEICSNLCFGGVKRNRLFMTASQSVYTVYVEAQGAHIC